MAKKKIENSTSTELVENGIEEVLGSGYENEPKRYLVPETKEEHLALYQLLKDMSIDNIGKLEVIISKI